MKPHLGPLIFCLSTVAVACTAPLLTSAPPVAVTVEVDFGIAARPPMTEQTLVPAGGSPIEALVDVAEVDQRFVSRTAGDVWGVQGVDTDEQASLFWCWRLNGRRAPSAPDRYVLRNGDRITWTYVQGARPEYR